MSIEVISVSKLYQEQEVLKKITFKANKGEIIGFLGPNGAGKSTMMKILTGYIKPNTGIVYVNGIDVLTNPIEAQKNIGYLPEHNPLYLDMYVREYLEFQASIFKVPSSTIKNCIEKVGLKTESHKKIGQLSKGYQQRVGLAAAILHNPKILILDEPTTGLDPNQLNEIRKLIKELGNDKTVLFSTHIMQEVEAVCNRVIIIKEGKILIDKLLTDLKKNEQQTIKVTFSKALKKELIQKIKGVVFCENVSENSWLITSSILEDIRPKIFDFAQEKGFKILELTVQNKNLESLFREITG